MADTSGNVNKVFGAVGLSGVSGALTEIASDIMLSGDVGFVVVDTNFYVYRCVEDGSPVNEPYVLMPSDSEDTNKRWKLTSINTLNGDVTQSPGRYFKTSKIIGNSSLSLMDGTGTEVARVDVSGQLWVRKLELESTEVAKNLNADMVDGFHADAIVMRDGSHSFTAPVSGFEPVDPSHFATKNYVDGKVALIEPAQYMRKDGTTAFTAPVPGVSPTYDHHLTTKSYVDEQINETLEEIKENQNIIVYKNGHSIVPVAESEMTVVFGTTLADYSVGLALVNQTDAVPGLYQMVITSKTPTSFTVTFGGEIDSSNYILDWNVIGIE